jgi:uncharacterized protein YbcI
MTETERLTGSRSDEISRRLVVLTKARTGKGPTRARTYISDDLIVCLLRDGMTQAERTLVAEDHGRPVAEMRTSIQESFRDEAVAMVEKIMDRRVLSFQSSHDINNDVAAEIFLLDPLAGGDGDVETPHRVPLPDGASTSPR